MGAILRCRNESRAFQKPFVATLPACAGGLFYGKNAAFGRGIKVRFGSRKILDIDRLELYDGDRIGLVGENGAGKTTLLDVLSGARSPDGGTVRRLAPVAVIRQDARTGPDRASAEYRRRFRAPEAGVNLSGGEENPPAHRAALSKGARVLLADEPTSDLDEAARAPSDRRAEGL